MKKYWVEMSVGTFMLLAILGMLMLAYQVSDFSVGAHEDSYTLKADFDNIGDLKIRAPVTIAGVRVGEVVGINLDKLTYKATVTIRLALHEPLPDDSTASILTAGLLGSNYISITPGYAQTKDQTLKTGAHITETHSAIILENLIGKLLFNIGNKEED